jgi:murein DD-endopeptidase MepM/ murein hydrolase activator NlpD
MKPVLIALGLLLGFVIAAEAETELRLSLPVGCALAKDCFIQQYVDIDPSRGAKDYCCGPATYDGHKGTDIRLLSVKAAEAGVPVLASAAGRVKAIRDGMEDRLVAERKASALVEGRECGNGAVIDHGDGWETQYCHLRRGSLKVRKGDAVKAGTPLGFVGYSGHAQFAHVHLSVRQNGKIIDPFLGEAINGASQSDGGSVAPSLWQEDLQTRSLSR